MGSPKVMTTHLCIDCKAELSDATHYHSIMEGFVKEICCDCVLKRDPKFECTVLESFELTEEELEPSTPTIDTEDAIAYLHSEKVDWNNGMTEHLIVVREEGVFTACGVSIDDNVGHIRFTNMKEQVTCHGCL